MLCVMVTTGGFRILRKIFGGGGVRLGESGRETLFAEPKLDRSRVRREEEIGQMTGESSIIQHYSG